MLGQVAFNGLILSLLLYMHGDRAWQEVAGWFIGWLMLIVGKAVYSASRP